MNILDIDEKQVRERLKKYGDLLKALYGEVESLNKLYSDVYDTSPSVNIYSKEGQKKIKWTIYCLTEELYELANILKNRPWVQTEVEIDINKLYDELADTTIFFIVLCQQLGVTPEMLVDIVIRKVIVNEHRINSGY